MPISKVTIHPRIGIARVGDSPSEYFVGPEKPREVPSPSKGFKDSKCRIKRQAAQFRLFAHHDDGSIDELTASEADITWKVHLANKKAAERSQPGTEKELTIDPGTGSVTGPNDSTKLNSGSITFPPDPSGTFSGSATKTVPLGELKTDGDARLQVLGGHGDSGSPTDEPLQETFDNKRWYDDVSDGWVKADVTIRSSGAQPTVESAWVVVGPPKFAPGLDNVISLWDRLYHLMDKWGHLTSSNTWGHDKPPSKPSYTEDVYPILERAEQSQWVAPKPGPHTHSWSHPVYGAGIRQYIWSRLKKPNQAGQNMDMPKLEAGTDMARLTKTQLDVMKKWKNDNFDRDWSGPPGVASSVTPLGMDKAALDNAMGAAFFPGMEVGGFSDIPVLKKPYYQGAFHLNPGATDPATNETLEPGDLTRKLAVPWQTDFMACGDNWWPVNRPNEVYPTASAGQKKEWTRPLSSKAGMVCQWNDLGFVVEKGGSYVETERCPIPGITPQQSTLDFGDVPVGPMNGTNEAARAVEFTVSAPTDPVTLDVQGSSVPANISVVNAPVKVGPTSGNNTVTARLWVVYRTGSPGDKLRDSFVVEHVEGCSTEEIDVTAKTVPRRQSATALVLDRSGSMDEDRGDGTTKHESLEAAASAYVDVALENDQVGLVRYNDDANVLEGVRKLGPADSNFTPDRTKLKNAITGGGLSPQGTTSIGDGIAKGRDVLRGVSPDHHESLVVLTDGKENEPRSIASVAGDIDQRTYAVGLGTMQNTSAPKLQAVAGNTDGYLLVTGNVGVDDEFRLKKYFLQILAGVSNANVVSDPEGRLTPGQEHRIPFTLSDADTGVDVLLLTAEPEAVDFRLEAPTGEVIAPWRAESMTDVRWVLTDEVTYYRLSLPVELIEDRDEREGEWAALLSLGGPRTEREAEDEREYETERAMLSAQEAGGAVLPESLQDMDVDVEAVRAAIEAGEGPAVMEAFEGEGKPPAALLEAIEGEGQPPGDLLEAIEGAGAEPTSGEPTTEQPILSEAAEDGLRYNLMVHAYSTLDFEAGLAQTGYEPGDELRATATLTQSGVPVADATVRADVRQPDGSTIEATLDHQGGGRYRATVEADTPGLYRLLIRATGRTRKGLPFQRERVATTGVWYGGNEDARASRRGDLAEPDAAELVCEAVACLGEEALDADRLAEAGIDVGALRECVQAACGQLEDPTGSEEVSAPADLSTVLEGADVDRDQLRRLLTALESDG